MLLGEAVREDSGDRPAPTVNNKVAAYAHHVRFGERGTERRVGNLRTLTVSAGTDERVAESRGQESEKRELEATPRHPLFERHHPIPPGGRRSMIRQERFEARLHLRKGPRAKERNGWLEETAFSSGGTFKRCWARW